MRTSVVIAAWNNQAMLDKTLRDLSRQTMMPDEIIVVDDGSETRLDARGHTLIALPKHEQPRTSGFARNIGVMYSSGDAIIICDHDQAIVSDAIESLVVRNDCIVSARRYGLEFDTDDADATDAILREKGELIDTNAPDMEHCLAMIPRHIFDALGGYDTESFTKWGWTNFDFSRRADELGFKTVVAKRPSGHTLYTFDRSSPFDRDFRAAAGEYHKRYGHLSMNQECDGCASVGVRYVGGNKGNILVMTDEDTFDQYKQMSELDRENVRTELGTS